MLRLHDHAGLDDTTRATLSEVLTGHRLLEDVVRWGLAFRPPIMAAGVIQQDEYTLDVVMPLPQALHASPHELFAVFDTT